MLFPVEGYTAIAIILLLLSAVAIIWTTYVRRSIDRAVERLLGRKPANGRQEDENCIVFRGQRKHNYGEHAAGIYSHDGRGLDMEPAKER